MNIYIEKEKCQDDAEQHNLIMSDEKCKPCEFYNTCRFIRQSYDDVIYGE